MALLASKFLPLDDDLNNSASEAESASEGKKGPRFWPNLRFRKSENLEKKITPKNIMQFIKRLAENHKALFSSMNPQIIPGAEEISSMEVEQTLSEKDVVAQLKLIDKLISWLRSKRGSSMEKKSQARLETVLDTLINEATTFVRLAYVPYMKTNTNKTYFEQILQKYQELLNILNNGDSTSREESTPVTTPAAIESSTQPAQGSAQNKSSAPENVTETLASSRTKILPTTPSEPEVPQSLAPDQPIEEDEQITKITNENFARMVGRLETKLLLLVPDDQNPHISETDITWLDNCITQFIIFFNSYPSNALSSFQRDFFWTIINDHIKILTNILRTAQLSPTINQKIEKLKRNYEDLKKIIESKPGVEAQKQSNDA